MSDCDIFCYPTTASEGFPKVVLEAMSQGMVVVATPVSAIPQLLGHGSNGVLLDDPGPGFLAEAIKKLIHDQVMLENLSLNAYNTSKKYTLEAWRNCIAEHLETGWSVNLDRKTL